MVQFPYGELFGFGDRDWFLVGDVGFVRQRRDVALLVGVGELEFCYRVLDVVFA